MSSPADALRRALQAIKEKFEEAGVQVEIYDDAIQDVAGELKETEAELVEEAVRRYPGIPAPLALARLAAVLPVLASVKPVKGLAWGGLHEEDIPDIVLRLVRQMYFGPKPIKSITIKIECEDELCEDYTHFWVEVVDVERPDGR